MRTRIEHYQDCGRIFVGKYTLVGEQLIHNRARNKKNCCLEWSRMV